MTFSSGAQTPPGPGSCHDDEMFYAIPDNLRYLKDYLEHLVEPAGTSGYINALEKSFDLLKDSENDRKKDIGKSRRESFFF